jgi:hypothetical protein
MRAIGLGSVSLVMVTLLVMDAADAASNAWCASYPGKGINDNCSYATQQQCLAQVAFADLIRFQGRRMGPATPGRQVHRAKRGANGEGWSPPPGGQTRSRCQPANTPQEALIENSGKYPLKSAAGTTYLDTYLRSSYS